MIMKKLYEEPIVEIRNYALPMRDVVMTSDIGGDDGGKNPDLGDGDDFELQNFFD